jgi:hypothetical protein
VTFLIIRCFIDAQVSELLNNESACKTLGQLRNGNGIQATATFHNKPMSNQVAEVNKDIERG